MVSAQIVLSIDQTLLQKGVLRQLKLMLTDAVEAHIVVDAPGEDAGCQLQHVAGPGVARSWVTAERHNRQCAALGESTTAGETVR